MGEEEATRMLKKIVENNTKILELQIMLVILIRKEKEKKEKRKNEDK